MVTTSTYKVFFGTTQLHEVFTTFLPHQYLDLGLWSCDCTTFKSTPKVTYFSHLLWKLFSTFRRIAVHKDIRNLGSHSSNGGSWPRRPLFLPSRDATRRWRIFCAFLKWRKCPMYCHWFLHSSSTNNFENFMVCRKSMNRNSRHSSILRSCYRPKKRSWYTHE